MALTLNVLFNYSFLDIYTAPYVFLAAVKKYIYKKKSSSNSSERVSIIKQNFVDFTAWIYERLSLSW